jgi:hypothetical protein
MAVTKQTYTAEANPSWSDSDLVNLIRDAFIDAGLMTAWHDEFTVGAYTVRVMKIEHDATKAFGTSYYYFAQQTASAMGVAIASGWDAATDRPTGDQFIDYHLFPANFGALSASRGATNLIGASPLTTSSIFLDRYTSAVDNKQSWFVFRQGANISTPFTILHKDTVLHPWLDLDKGIISGCSTVVATAYNRQGYVDFRLQENIRRCLLIGHALRGDTVLATSGASGSYHAINLRTHSYCGLGSQSSQTSLNYSSPVNGGAVILPVGRNSVNPAFLADYVPICTNLPWSPFTPTLLADDFGIYMHYADNTTAYGDKFIAQAGVNEWETLQFANNSNVVDGASPAFLARVV